MEIKTKALCVLSTDYRDNDKLLTLVSVELGKIVAQIRSVKSPKSKLKMCASPMCFGEYILLKTGDRYTVIGCSIDDNFFACWEDMSRYTASQVVLETLRKATIDGVDCKEELHCAMQALSAICYAETSPFLSVAWYLTKQLIILGEDITAESLPLRQEKFIALLQNVAAGELDGVDITPNVLAETLKYLNLLLTNNLSAKINSLSEAIKQINEL